MTDGAAHRAPPRRMATMGPQRPQAPASAAARRARFFNSANAFNLRYPTVPAARFDAARQAVLAADAATGYLACDQSAELGGPGPATTPLLLARYARIAPGETLAASFAASGSIWYVIAGQGRCVCRQGAQSEELAFGAGDVMLLPGGAGISHHAGADGAILWSVTDEPLLAFGALRATGGESGGTFGGPVHYPAAEIGCQLDRVLAAEPDVDTSGRALIFSTEALESTHNLHPLMTLSLNTLAPGEAQAAHRHNSAAITLVLDGDDCHSLVDGRPIGWEPWATLVTPPGAVHSHHNGGTATLARFLIVQDGGLYYRARTMGFESRP